MFISVDLPAPLAPTTAWISPASAAKSTCLSATTPGITFRSGCGSPAMAWLASRPTVWAGTQPAASLAHQSSAAPVSTKASMSAGAMYSGGHGHATGDRLAGENIHADLDRDLSGAGREGNGTALVMRGHPFQPAIVLVAGRKGDFAKTPGLVEGFGHADRHLPGRREHAVDLGEALQQVLGDLLGLGAVPVAVFDAEQLDVGVLLEDGLERVELRRRPPWCRRSAAWRRSCPCRRCLPSGDAQPSHRASTG